MAPSVQFVSKPVDPPINDGTKHIVLTVAGHLERYAPRVMTTRATRSVGEGIAADDIYASASSYAPSLFNNARAAKHLLLSRRAALWHFVFAPNLRSSQMGRFLSRTRRVPVVQTIASRPKTFAEPLRLLFGDVVVAQSADTRARFLTEMQGVPEAHRPRIEVILPPLGEVRVPDLEATNAVRRALEVDGHAPLLLYPGDLEVGQGARRVADAARQVAARHPTAVVVFAYRDKTVHAQELAAALQRELGEAIPSTRVRFVRECDDIAALVRTSAAVLFPVDELYGKVDIPIVLLQAMALGTPVVTSGEGPLRELEGVATVAAGDAQQLAELALALIDDHGRRGSLVEAQRRLVDTRFSAGEVARAYERLYDELVTGSG